MKQNIIIWFLVLLTSVSYAQQVTIIDKETGKPLEGVILMGGDAQTNKLSNAKGIADISSFQKADKILISYVGYETQTTGYVNLKALDTIRLEESQLNLNRIVVSATRWHQVSSHVPSKISSISAKEVALQNPQSAADLLGISGKVFIQKSQQGGGSPMIRGFATNRLIYTVDGVRMNTAIFRGGNIQNVINIDPFATENTEVLFGPGSVIYGSDAIGGVMSFQTLTPQFSNKEEAIVSGKALTRYSSANSEQTGHFDVNVGWKKWAFVTSFSSWDFDHLRQGSNGPTDYVKNVYVQRRDSADVVITQTDELLQIPSAYSQINIMQKVRFAPNEKWDFQYGFHYSTTSDYGRYDRHNRFRNGTPIYGEWDYGPQKWLMNNLNISHKNKTVMYDEVSLRLAQQQFEESRKERKLNKETRNTNAERVDATSVNLDFTKAKGTRHILFYGAEYILNDVTSTGLLTSIITGSTLEGPSRYPQAKWHSAGVYISDEILLTDNITLAAGIRYNAFLLDADFSNNLKFYPFSFTEANIRNGALTGSIGSVFRPSENTVIKANFGTAFRAPNVDDIGKVFDSEPGTVTVPNTDLQAEYAYNFDIGIAKIINKTIKLDLTGYYTLLDNAMVRRNYTLNGQDSILYQGELSGVQAIQNAAVANVYGLQAGIEVKLPAGFIFLSDINFQLGEEELDDGTKSTARHTAPTFGVSRLRYKQNKLQLELNAFYQGTRTAADLPQEEQSKTEIYAKDESGNNYSPAWYTLNFKASYQLSETFSLGSGIENITDQRYRPYSSGISGAGRNFLISLSAKF